MPWPPQGPISEFLIVMLLELVMVTQSPEAEVIFKPLITVPLCPLMLTGPEEVRLPLEVWLPVPEDVPVPVEVWPPVPVEVWAAVTAKVIFAVPVPLALAALKLIEEVPAAPRVPEMSPVSELMESPAGRPVALKLVGVLVAVTW